MNQLVRVVARRAFARAGRMVQPGERLELPFDEAASMIKFGAALPEGAEEGFDAPPLRSWATCWRWPRP